MASDRPRFAVKHFMACSRVQVPVAGPEVPYNLWGVGYKQTVPPDQEWPVRLEELWLYARFYYGTGRKSLTIGVLRAGAPPGTDAGVVYYPADVMFPNSTPVLNWSWNVSGVRYPGPGVYIFRLTHDRTGRVLAEDHVHIHRSQS